jgi:UDP-glucose 4-epimerase
MHFAAFASVNESVIDPAKYYQNNVVASLNLLEAMRAAGVGRIVFSSTTATYGVPERVPITEDDPQRPINPYGFAKLVVEQALADYSAAYGLGYAVLRYFNAAGASPNGDLGEDHTPETHLIPIVLEVALGKRRTVFGDYPAGQLASAITFTSTTWAARSGAKLRAEGDRARQPGHGAGARARSDRRLPPRCSPFHAVRPACGDRRTRCHSAG